MTEAPGVGRGVLSGDSWQLAAGWCLRWFPNQRALPTGVGCRRAVTMVRPFQVEQLSLHLFPLLGLL